MLMARPGIIRLGKVPSRLIKEFEHQVLECYLEYGYYDIAAITGFVEDFAIFAESHEQTGNPYQYHASEEISTDELKDIISRNFYGIKDDVMTILDYYRMFYVNREYKLREYHNIPIVRVW